MAEHKLLKFMFFQGCWPVRAGWLRLTIHARPPTLDGHNFFVRSLFRVFLDSMESPLSEYSSNMMWSKVGENYLLKSMFFQGFWTARAGYSCVASNFGQPLLIRQNSVLGVLELYGKPIESRFQPCACGGQWLNITLLKFMFCTECAGCLVVSK